MSESDEDYNMVYDNLLVVSNKGVKVTRDFTPVVDSNGHFFKAVISD